MFLRNGVEVHKYGLSFRVLSKTEHEIVKVLWRIVHSGWSHLYLTLRDIISGQQHINWLLACSVALNWKSGVAGCAIIIYGSFCTKPSFVAHREVSSGVYVLVKIFRWWKFRVKVQEPLWNLGEFFGGAHSSSQRWGEKSASRRLILESLREDPQTGRGWKGLVHMLKRRG